jgi:hypothetical protein
VNDCRRAIEILSAPDPDSRTKDEQGRRIAPIAGGWVLINYLKYREMGTYEDRRIQAASRQRRLRERRNSSGHSNAPSRSVTPCHAPSRSVTQESRKICQAEAEADVLLEKEPKARARKREKLINEARETTRTAAIPVVLNHQEFLDGWAQLCAMRERMAGEKGVAWTPAAATAMLKTCSELGVQWAIAELRASVANSWRGVFPDHRRNPEDVRSQVMTRGSRESELKKEKERFRQELKRSRPSLPTIPGDERATANEISEAKAAMFEARSTNGSEKVLQFRKDES